ncbi:MAG: ABC-type Fe3+-hydroxamate transport system [Methanophagales archaeon]|nr:ABC transporter substrate-binding protein [Methanophagales archaeon]MCU4140805.1 ABC-type Fe3+-hydroxamate transport system [Methanophagales archaeon]
MKKIILALLFTSMLLAVMPIASGKGMKKIPGDANNDEKLTEEELASAIISYMLGEAGHLEIEDLRDAAHVYAYWGGEPKRITDSAGRNITIYKPIKRVVVFNSETVETMRSLNASDKIVGACKYAIQNDLFFPEFKNLTNVGSVWSPNYEEVLKCQPDTVFLYATVSVSYCDEIEKTLKELDPSITVIRFDCFKPSSYAEEVRKLGYILEREEEAEDLIDFYEGFLSQIYDKVEDIPEENRTRVYIEAWRPYHTAGNGSGWHEKVELVGGYNIFSDFSGYFDVDAEEVARRNPDVIIRIAKEEGGYDTSDATELSDLRDEIMNRSELSGVSAVKNGRVYVISTDILGGVRHFVGMGYIAKWLYPEMFSDLNPEEIHRQYLVEFQGLSEDLVSNGVFVYPER